ncbi:MAG: hypothetical protein K2V38_16980, partial [Gemmataceae bacterium]|nr:hypothetical protein [Gemmataceae bacterium]
RVYVWDDVAVAEKPDPRPQSCHFRIENVPGLDFAPDGALLATNVLAKADLWDPGTGSVVRAIPHTHSKHHGPVKFSPDGTKLAVGYRNVVSVYPATDGGFEPVTCKGHTDAVWSACWSADGRTLLSASADGTARLWNPASGAEVRAFEWGLGKLHAAAFSADGLLGAAASADGRVVVWDVDG